MSQSRESKRLLLQPTGVSGLDLVLGGGLPRGELVLVVGPPGSGKTTLASQMAFAAARAGQHVLLLTALSESTSKLLAHLRSFTFFDADLVGDQVQVLSLQQFLPQGLETTADEMVTLARKARAELVVLDGFRGVRGADAEPQRAREFLYQVGTTLSVLGATTLVTSEAEPRDPTLFPELTTADVVLGVYYGLNGVRQQRAIEAIKVRGAAPLPGLHALQLTAAGGIVYPRLESRVAAVLETGMDEESEAEEQPPDGVTDRRVTFDLAELDVLLGGGLTRGTTTLLQGSLGTGKTLLALHLVLAAVRRGEPALFVGFRETARQLQITADAFELGSELRAALVGSRLLQLLRLAPVELEPDRVADRLLSRLERSGARLLVIDSVGELERAVLRSRDPGRLEDYLAAFIEMLRRHGVTALFVKETRRVLSAELDIAADTTALLAENILLVQQVTYQGQLHRVLSVPKMRFSAHDQFLREFTIAPPAGIRVLAPFESGVGVLAGIVHEQGRPADTEEGR